MYGNEKDEQKSREIFAELIQIEKIGTTWFRQQKRLSQQINKLNESRRLGVASGSKPLHTL